MNYLSILAKQKQASKPEGLQSSLNYNNKTAKQYHHSPPELSSSSPIFVELSLPEELKEQSYEPSSSTQPPLVINTPIHLEKEQHSTVRNSYISDKDVPYGCLKGGLKQTYKQWNSTQKNRPPVVLENNRVSLNSNIEFSSDINSERENKLRQLKEKMRKKQEENSTNDASVFNHSNLINAQEQQQDNSFKLQQSIYFDNSHEVPSQDSILQPQKIHTSNLIKKTIKSKVTVGKSLKTNKIGVLIKDKQTRKQIIHAQKELKKKPINDVKKYLRDRGFMKVGSNAPNDVVRKMYESSMLTGELTNNNKDILMHNFVKESESS